ncbi:MAG TPA: MBL fold metallo-hydrolase [Myxococcales bacterium]|nr:MBL fold metallo-hydrolase [Myxococcales bacterium]
MFLALLLAAETLQSLSAFETVKVADGVYTFVAHQTQSPLVSGNVTAVIGDGGVLLVDTGHFPSGTRRMLDELRKLTPQPVRWVVNTHWHPDHDAGNSVVLDAFPQAVIVSTQATREAFETELPKFGPAAQRKLVEPAKEMLRSGKTPSGKALTDAQRKRLSEAIEETDAVLPDLEQSRQVTPSLAFARELALWLGRREVDVRFLGRGNTAGDAVVYVPDAKVLITGDLVVYPVPYAFGSFFGEWVKTMDALLAIDAAAIVPGHGPVMRDKRYLQLVRDLLARLVEQANAAAARGQSAEEARKAVDLGALRAELTRGDAELDKELDAFVLDPGVPRALREAKEGPLKDEN